MDRRHFFVNVRFGSSWFGSAGSSSSGYFKASGCQSEYKAYFRLFGLNFSIREAKKEYIGTKI